MNKIVLLFFIFAFAVLSVEAKEFYFNSANIEITTENEESLVDEKEFSRLVKNLKKFKVSSEEISDLYYARANWFRYEQKDTMYAMNNYTKALEYNPQNKKVLLEISDLEFYEKDYNSALFYVKKLILLNPDERNYHSMAASIYVLLEQYDDAIEELQKANASKNELASVYYLRGKFSQEQNDLNNALSDFNTALKYNPHDREALLAASYIKNEFKDYNGALNDIKKLISLYPNNSGLYYLEGLIYSQLKQYHNAINACTKSIVLKNKNPHAFYWRAVNELKLRQDEKAFKDLEYAKQQYYEMNDIENYKHISNVISILNEINANSIISKPYQQSPNNQYFSDNTESVKELKKINKNLENINRAKYMFPKDNNRDLQMLDLFFNKSYTNSSSVDFRDLQILYGF